MEQLSIEQALNEMAQAYATLENAKEDCKDVVGSALDAYFGEITPTDKEDVRAAKAARKIEAGNMKKLAKAMAKGEKEGVKEEAENMASLIEELG
jgi:hypothetical protein